MNQLNSENPINSCPFFMHSWRKGRSGFMPLLKALVQRDHIQPWLEFEFSLLILISEPIVLMPYLVLIAYSEIPILHGIIYFS